MSVLSLAAVLRERSLKFLTQVSQETS